MANLFMQSDMSIVITLINAGVSIIVAVIASIIAPIVVEKWKERKTEEKTRKAKSEENVSTKPSDHNSPKQKKRKRGYVSAPVIGIIFGVSSFLLLRPLLPKLLSSEPVSAPKPSISIISPYPGQEIEVRQISTGSSVFSVSGDSTNVYSHPDLRVYVLVHPFDPPAAGWWIQDHQPAVDKDGKWETNEVWIGSQQFRAKKGDTFDILAVVTEPAGVQGRKQINNPKDIKPVAQSEIVRVKIGSVK